MRTSYKITLIARPHLGRHHLASYLSNGVHPSVVYQYFKAIVILFVALSVLWLSVIHIGLVKLKLCHGWKWYVGSLGGNACSPDLSLLCALICWYLSGGRQGVTRAHLIR